MKTAHQGNLVGCLVYKIRLIRRSKHVLCLSVVDCPGDYRSHYFRDRKCNPYSVGEERAAEQ